MTIDDFNNILIAINENKEVKIGYQLHSQLRKVINALSGTAATLAFFQELARAEPASFDVIEENKIE